MPRTMSHLWTPPDEDTAPRRTPAERLESYLGDPEDPAGMLSYARAAAADATETFPAEACALLDLWGLPDHYVPAEHGGRLRSYQELLGLVRTLARRDLTVAVAHAKTFLGSVCVWVSGDRAAARRLADRVHAGDAVALGLTERYHGSDLMAGEVTAWPVAAGYLLNGEKWLINNATRARLVCLLARTGPDPGPRAFSILLADKRDLPAAAYRELPKVPTHGIRGADISGITFDDAVLPAHSLVGETGAGAEIVLKSLQISRTLCPALSLGAADQGLRLAVRFTRERRLYGRTLAELPLTRRTLGEIYADLLAMEALSTVAARSIHLLPQELSLTSAVAKYLVPTVVDDVLTRLGGLLGARSYLTAEFADGRFQKTERDHRIVAVFDGNTMVNLYGLISQFRALARHHPATPDRLPDPALYDPDAPLPPARLADLALISRHGSSILGALPDHTAALTAAAAADPALAGAARAAHRLTARAARLLTALPKAAHTVTGTPPESFDRAAALALCTAGAACLGVWRHAPRIGRHWPAATWLEPALHRLLARLDATGPTGPTDPATGDRTATRAAADDAVFGPLTDRLTDQYLRGEVFSLLPSTTAEGAPR
ncbi:acyl-CoA dehydrogenase [Streptomyces sp. NPDC059101]|uniref:acyl-CoA dehydrogenase n=1 Tax=Streptomyces sp. NPDC059101 TaxID=3346728 RepID=UPI003680C5A9